MVDATTIPAWTSPRRVRTSPPSEGEKCELETFASFLCGIAEDPTLLVQPTAGPAEPAE
jgi:hypothetical protein